MGGMYTAPVLPPPPEKPAAFDENGLMKDLSQTNDLVERDRIRTQYAQRRQEPSHYSSDTTGSDLVGAAAISMFVGGGFD